jgi:stage II sporulation protein M
MQLVTYWRRNLEDFLRRHSGPALLLATLFVVGVIFGALAVHSIEARDRLELVSYLSSNLQRLVTPPEGTGGVLFRQGLWGKLKLLALLWVLGISLVGVVGVMLLVFLEGLLSGFVVGFVAAEMGGTGILLAIAGHLPQRLLEVPAIIVAGTASVAFSLQVIRSWRQRRRVRNFYPALAAFTGTLLAMGVLLVLSSLVESYVSPALVRFVLSMVKGA